MKLRDYKKNLKTEYQNTFKQKNPKREFHFKFKLRYALLTVAGIIFAALLIQHIWVYSYNIGVEKYNQAIANRVNLEHSTEFYAINTKEDYNQAVSTYQKQFSYQHKITSILSNLFSFQFIGCGSVSKSETSPAPEGYPSNSYQTNIQVEGIDEADVAKCDGNYIYYLYLNKLSVYDIKAEKELTSTLITWGQELYVYNNLIISIESYQTTIYELNQDELIKKKEITYGSYLTSRLVQNKLYLIGASYLLDKNIQYENCYYNVYSSPRTLYSLYCFDLDTMESKETQLMASNAAILYASNQAFYFANKNRNYTSISIFSYDLDPLGIVNVYGDILNQFSMDEYNGYLRVVSTDTTRNAEELNAITIFDLSNLEKVGYLDQKIGLERQTVRSVRFDGTKCYVVTYETKDPLYEIDCSNPENPTILSAYQAPGYSSYLHAFKIKDKEYVLGLGYTDSNYGNKISVYEKTEEGTLQIGKDFVLSYTDYYSKADYYNKQLLSGLFTNHKALFIYNDDTYLYLGTQVAYDTYLIFKIDVETEDIVTIYKEIKLHNVNQNYSRLFMIENKIYVTDCDRVIVDDFS